MPKAIRSLFQGLLAAGLLMAAQGVNAQQSQLQVATDLQVPLHILPNVDSPVYTEADITVLDRFNPQPLVSKDFIGQGWEMILYRGNYIGFVRNETLAGNYVRPGTTVYMGPSEQSQPMQKLENSRQSHLNRRVNDDWSEVTFNGVIPLYFIRNINMSQNSIAANDPILTGNVARTHLGKLERVSAVTRMLGGNYDYQLADQDGKVIAFVDVNNALYVGRIEDYWNKWVNVEGISRKRAGTVPLVIEARFLSLR